MRTVALYEMLFGLLTIIGGIVGYVAADSLVSLIAGPIAGLILVFAGLRMQKGSKSGLYTALIITILLLGQFGSIYFFGENATFMWSGLMSVLAILSLLLLILLLLQPTERKRDF